MKDFKCRQRNLSAFFDIQKNVDNFEATITTERTDYDKIIN